MSRTYKTEAIVLKGVNFGEADKFLTVFTKHYGKLKVIAKGIRKPTSRKSGNLENFNHVKIFLAKGKNLDLITEVEVKNTFRSWRKNLTKVTVAYYFCELVDKLTPEGQKNRAVFELLREFLSRLKSEGGAKTVRTFEEKLLDLLGFGVPENFKNTPGSLKNYLETVTERKIKSPEVLRNLEKN